MKTSVTQTSLESYFFDIKAGKELSQEQKVLNAVKSFKGKATINEIARKLSMYPSTVSARLNGLKKKGLTSED